MDEIINSPLLWLICSITIMVVAAQAYAYYKLARKNAKLLGMSDETCAKSFKVGMVAAVGPALGILIVLVGMMAVLGGPLTWMRLSIIVSATNEMAAAKFGADAAGVTFGGADFTALVLFVAWFGMALNGIGSMLSAVFFAGHLEKIRTKVVNKNPKILALVSGAAMCAIYGNLSSGTVINGGGNIGAWLVAGIATYVLYVISQRVEKLKEYSLGIAMLAGTIAGAVVQSIVG